MDAFQVAFIVYQAMLETDINCKELDYMVGAHYIVLTNPEQKCALGPLRMVLPRRICKNGKRPGITVVNRTMRT